MTYVEIYVGRTLGNVPCASDVHRVQNTSVSDVMRHRPYAINDVWRVSLYIADTLYDRTCVDFLRHMCCDNTTRV